MENVPIVEIVYLFFFVLKWVNSRTGKYMKIVVPFENGKLMGIIGIILLIITFFFYKPQLIQNNRLLSNIVISIIIICCSGHTWNRIFNPPFSTYDQKTNNEKFLINDAQYQMGAEFYFIFFIYLISLFGFIFLNHT
jgi:hypothetical protein